MHTLTHWRGTSYSFQVTYTRTGGTLIGGTVRFTVKSEMSDLDADDSTAIFQTDVTSVIDATHAQIDLVPADMALTPTGDYFYDIKVEEADGKVYRLDSGTWKLRGTPTNRVT